MLLSAWAIAVVGLACSGAAAEIAASTSAPLQVPSALIPQIVLLTFDDSVTTAALARVKRVLSGRANPNGQPIKATFFVSLDSTYDPASIRQLYDAGCEIAVHTMSHETGESTGLTRWRQEIAGCRFTLSRLCAIPESEIVGFRAPFLQPNDAAFRVLAERGFRYDSSFPEGLSGLSTSPANMVWPYTLDHGLAQAAPPARAPAAGYPGLFEIPLWGQFTNGAVVTVMDPPESLSTNEVTALWQANFLARYQGNRAPYGLFLHNTSSGQWLSNPAQAEARIAALGAFIDWALAQPDTWFLTCRDLTEYMCAPVPAPAAASHAAFQTPARTPFPTSALVRCSFPDSHAFYACGTAPLAAPSYSNAFLDAAAISGGAAAVNIVSQNASYVWCELTVTNDTQQRLYDWSARFALAGGDVQSLFDAVWAQAGGEVTAQAKPYNRQLAPGAWLKATFRVRRAGGPVDIGPAALSAIGLGPRKVQARLARVSGDSPSWRLAWNDCALQYCVETTTSLAPPQVWTAVTNGLGLTELQLPGAGDARFFRVSGTLE